MIGAKDLTLLLIGSDYPWALEGIRGNACFGYGKWRQASNSWISLGISVSISRSFIPWLFFSSLPKNGPEEEQILMRLTNSIIKHQKCNLITTQSHHPHITRLPRWDLRNTQKCQVLFVLTSGMKCSGRNLQCSGIFSVQC